MRTSLTLLLSIIVLLSACNPERVRYTSELKQEMADSKIKRITNADMVETVNTFGDKISAVVQKELTTQLGKTTNPAERTKLCQLRNLPRTQAITTKYALGIQLLGAADARNKSLNPKERELVEAYLYNAEQKLPQISNIQKINDTLFVYNVAVPTDNPICEACFSNQKTPFALWRLAFSKREVVRRMAGTKKKK